MRTTFIAFVLVAVAACSYDLGALHGTGDGGAIDSGADTIQLHDAQVDTHQADTSTAAGGMGGMAGTGGVVVMPGTGGIVGTGGSFTGGTGGQAVAPPLEGCTGGRVVMVAEYWCRITSGLDESKCNPDGTLHGYYAGLPCPFDVAIAHVVGWSGPCDGCIDGKIITNAGTSRSAAWRANANEWFCCGGDGKTMRAIPKR